MQFRFPSHFWNTCEYKLRSIVVQEEISRHDGWHRHWHPFWVIDVWGASRGWTRVRGKTYRRERNSVAVYAPRTNYEEKTEAGKLYAFAWILLEETHGGLSPLRHLTAETGTALIEDAGDQIREIIERTASVAVSDSPGKAFFLAAGVNQVVGKLLHLSSTSLSVNNTVPKPASRWVHPWKRAVRMELERVFPGTLSVEAFAKTLNVSPSTLTHKYRELCGETFRETIQHWRLEKAHVLLGKKDVSIKEISTHLGFAHPSHLTAFLKKHTGHSPSALRRILAESP